MGAFKQYMDLKTAPSKVPWTAEETLDFNFYSKAFDLLLEKADKTHLSEDAITFLHHLLSTHYAGRAITYSDFYHDNFKFPQMDIPTIREELEDKGFIKSHRDVEVLSGMEGKSIGDVCEFLYITENFPCV